jgi:hypothetical protein
MKNHSRWREKSRRLEELMDTQQDILTPEKFMEIISKQVLVRANIRSVSTAKTLEFEAIGDFAADSVTVKIFAASEIPEKKKWHFMEVEIEYALDGSKPRINYHYSENLDVIDLRKTCLEIIHKWKQKNAGIQWLFPESEEAVIQSPYGDHFRRCSTTLPILLISYAMTLYCLQTLLNVPAFSTLKHRFQSFVAHKISLVASLWY